MDHETVLKRFRTRLVMHGVLKSALWGIAAGCGVLFITAFITWLCGMDGGIWLSLGLGAGLGVAFGFVCYFLKYRPTDKYVARRVDELGLEERTVTMLDYGNDDSYLAQRQRDDALFALKSASDKKIKIGIPLVLIISLCVTSVLGCGMGVVSGLAENGVIPSGKDVIDTSRDSYFEVVYLIDGDGEIDGDDVQILQRGEQPAPVMAIAADGWVFAGWDDGLKNPYRHDSKLDESAIFTARFMMIEDGEEEEEGDGEGDFDGEGDSDPEGPEGDGGQADGGEGTGDGDKGDGDGTGDGGQDGNNQGGSGQGSGAGFKYDEKNQILDGETYYGDEIENYRRKLEEKLANNEDLTEAERRFIELYFGSL
ncbi:MAG: hypothetical protein OSJ83_06835 [Clostridia bacterium]|nr:hypothetical protein [Clostridia bacterium]